MECEHIQLMNEKINNAVEAPENIHSRINKSYNVSIYNLLSITNGN